MSMPSPPPDTRAPGQTGHIADHNTISDALASLEAGVLALESAVADIDVESLVPTIYMPAPTGFAPTDTANVQSVINMSAPGATIGFLAGVYDVNAPIVFLGDRQYVGMGVAKSDYGATIRQADGANIGAGLTGGAFRALFEDSIWATGSGGTLFCDDPVIVSNLCFDVNAAGNGSSVCVAVASINFWSIISDCQVQNTTSHGIVLTDTCFSGTVITNSASQNRVRGNQFDTIGGDGLRQICANGISNLDGFCEGNIFNTIGGHAVNFDSAAGWKFQSNHIYGIQLNAINLSACFATSVEDNYIEDFGGQAASGQFYAGISANQLDGRGSVIHGNFVSCAEDSALVGGYQYIAVSSGFDESDAQVVVTGNQIHGPASPTSKGTGLVYQIGGGSSALTIVSADNLVTGVDTPSFVSDGVTFGVDAANPALVYSPGAVQALTTGSTIATTGAHRLFPVTETASVTGAILGVPSSVDSPVTIVNRSNFTITFAASGTSHVAAGASAVIAALSSRTFAYDSGTNLWY